MIRPLPSSTTVTPKKERRGATMLEYLFMLSLIIVVVIASVQYVGSKTKGLFEHSQEKIVTKNNDKK